MTPADLREYNGWAKIGCVLLTMEDDLDAINKRLDGIVRRLFSGREGFLPLEVIDEDGDAPTALEPHALRRADTFFGVAPDTAPGTPKAEVGVEQVSKRRSASCVLL